MLVERSSGPLPHPALLERYDAIVPGGAERIFGWVEQQSAHRQKLERIKIEGDVRNERLGQHYAFVIAILVICLSGLLIWTDRDVMGFSLVLADVAALVGVFLYSRRSQAKERTEKMKALQAQPED